MAAAEVQAAEEIVILDDSGDEAAPLAAVRS